MQYIRYDEFKNTDLGKEFLKENPSTGTLKIEAFMAYQSVPFEGVQIIISKDIEDYRVIFFQGTTDSSGMISDIILPAPEQSSSESLENPKYTIYNMTAIKEDYHTINNYNIGMFGGVPVIQYVKMQVEENNREVADGN